MTKDNPIIQYTQITSSTFGDKKYLKLFESGVVQTTTSNYFEKEKILSESNIGKEQILSYVNQLIEAGFQNCEPTYRDISTRDGRIEELELNYNRINKTVRFENNRGSKRLNDLIDELTGLMKE